MREAPEALLAIYVSDEHATAALDHVVALMRSGSLKVIDLGILRRDLNGKISLESPPAKAEDAGVSQWTSRGRPRRAHLSPERPGFVDRRRCDRNGRYATEPTGIDVASLRRIGAMLDPGESAILAMVDCVVGPGGRTRPGRV